MDEALALGERVAVILNGKIRQVGPPETVFSAPADPEVAAFVGVETILPGKVTQVKDGLALIDVNGQSMEAAANVSIGRQVFYCLRPEDITLWVDKELVGSSARNRLSGQITRLIPIGPLVRVSVECGVTVVALVTRASANEMDLHIGQKVSASFSAFDCALICYQLHNRERYSTFVKIASRTPPPTANALSEIILI
jgi:molybdopterin-binding protein